MCSLWPNGPIKLNLPKKANISGIVSGRLLATLDEDWIQSGSTRFAADSMISYGLGKWKQDPLRGMPSLVFEPEPRRALSGFAVTKNLLMAIADNVQRKTFIYRYDQGTWQDTPIPLPTNENVSLSAASEETDVVLFTVSNYLGPTSLWYFDAASEGLEILRTTPPKFNPSRHVAEQFEATSLGGTRIPTFWCVPRTLGSERRSQLFSMVMADSSPRSCHPVRERWGGSCPTRAVHMSSRTCGAAASLGRDGTTRPKRQRSSGHGMISSPLRRT